MVINVFIFLNILSSKYLHLSIMLWWLINRLVKCKNVAEVLFVEIVFVVSTSSSHIATESPIILPAYLLFLQLHIGYSQNNLFHTHNFLLDSYTHTDNYHYPTFDSSYILLSKLNSHLHDILFISFLYSFILVIIWRTCKFKSSFSFGTHTLLDRLLRELLTSNTAKVFCMIRGTKYPTSNSKKHFFN